MLSRSRQTRLTLTVNFPALAAGAPTAHLRPLSLPALSAIAGRKLMKNFPCQCLDRRGRARLPTGNRTAHAGMSRVGPHPCSRRSSSFPDEAPAGMPASARQFACRTSWASVSVRQCTIASSASLSNGRCGYVFCIHRSNASCKNRLANRDARLRLAVFPDAPSGGRPPLALALSATAQCRGPPICACFFTARISRSWSMLSKKPVISRSMTQSSFQQLLVRPWPPAPTSQDDIQRNRDETAATTGSSLDFTTICAIRSAYWYCSACVSRRWLLVWSPFARAAESRCPTTSDSRADTGCPSPRSPQTPQLTAHPLRLLRDSPSPFDTLPRPLAWQYCTALPHSSAPPLAGWLIAFGSTPPPLRPSLYRGLRRSGLAAGTASVLSPAWVFHLSFSVRIGAPGSHVPSNRL